MPSGGDAGVWGPSRAAGRQLDRPQQKSHPQEPRQLYVLAGNTFVILMPARQLISEFFFSLALTDIQESEVSKTGMT